MDARQLSRPRGQGGLPTLRLAVRYRAALPGPGDRAHTIVLNGIPIVSKSPGLDRSALRGSLMTCTFKDSPTRAFVVTGILAPTIPSG